MKSKIIAAVIAALTVISTTASTIQAGEDPAKAIIPAVEDSSSYIFLDIWALGIKGDVGMGGLTSSIDVGFDDILDNLDATLAGGFGFEKGKWGAMTEFLWVKMSSDTPTPGPLFRKADIGVEQFIGDGHISYRFFDCPQGKGYIDVIGGVRYFYMDNSISFAPGLAPRRLNAGDSESWWDAYGGIKGEYNLTDKWFIPFRADVGGGGSSLTWQGMAGVGYHFNPSFDMRLAYRYMVVDYNDGGFLYDVESSGLIWALRVNF